MSGLGNNGTSLAATHEESVKNARSIDAIPWSELSDKEAFKELLWRALQGQDVYAYIPAASATHVLWVGGARHIPAEWARQWRAAGCPSAQDEATAEKEAAL